MRVVAGCAGDGILKEGQIDSFISGFSGECFPHLGRYGYQMVTAGGVVNLLPPVAADAEGCRFIPKRDLGRCRFILSVREGLVTPQAGFLPDGAALVNLQVGIPFPVVISRVTGKAQISGGVGKGLTQK